MNELALKNIWLSANDKLEKTIIMNTKEISQLKVKTFLHSMKPAKVFTILIGFIWIAIGSSLLSNIYLNSFLAANKFFLFSATIQIFITAIALIFYVYQLVKIYQIDISEPILQTQEKLSKLKISTLWSAKILFLQLPVFTTFWWNKTMIENWNLLQWIITGSVTIFSIYISFWLFNNIKIKNRNANWFKLIFNGKEWTPLMKSIEMLEQVENFKG
jgi:hypothetical protein